MIQLKLREEQHLKEFVKFQVDRQISKPKIPKIVHSTFLQNDPRKIVSIFEVDPNEIEEARVF